MLGEELLGLRHVLDEVGFVPPAALVEGANVEGPGPGPHHEELGDVQPHDGLAHEGVLAHARVPELEHLAEHGPGAPAAGAAQGGQGAQGGAHGLGVGVVGVVDDRDAVRPVRALHAEAAGRAEAVQDPGDVRRRHARGVGRGGRGEHVVGVVQAGQAGGERVAGRVRVGADLQVEGGPLVVVGVQRARGDEAGGAPGGDVLGGAGGARLVGGEPGDGGLGAGGHGGDPVVVEIEDDGALGAHGLRELALGGGDVRHAAEAARVRGAHHEDDAHVRAHDVAQVGDVAHVVRAHLHHEVAGLELGPEDGQRHADLAVVGAHGRHGGALGGQQGGQQVLRGGLARRAGDADDGGRRVLPDAAHDLAGEGAHGQDRVLHHDRGVLGAVGRLRGSLGEHGDGTGGQGGVDEVVAVGPLPRLGDVEGPLGRDLAGVGGDVDQHSLRVEGGRERAGHGLGDLGGGESDHDSSTLPPRGAPEPGSEARGEAAAARAARASRRACRSSRGTSSPS